MHREAIFDLREHTVERVRGVRQIELRISLIREESYEFCFQGAVCRPYPAMSIYPSLLRVKCGTPFAEKGHPSFMPGAKTIGEVDFSRLGEGKG